MIFLKKTDYISDITLLLQELKNKDTTLEHRQRLGRSIFWDKPNAYQNRKDYENNLKTPAYKYYNL